MVQAGLPPESVGASCCPIPHSGTSPPLCQSLGAPLLICVHWHVEQTCCVCEFSEPVSTHSHAELSLSLWHRHLSKMTLQSSMPPETVTDALAGAAVQAAEDRWGRRHLLSQLALERGAEDQARDQLQPGHLLQPPGGWACPTPAPPRARNWPDQMCP